MGALGGASDGVTARERTARRPVKSDSDGTGLGVDPGETRKERRKDEKERKCQQLVLRGSRNLTGSSVVGGSGAFRALHTPAFLLAVGSVPSKTKVPVNPTDCGARVSGLHRGLTSVWKFGAWGQMRPS